MNSRGYRNELVEIMHIAREIALLPPEAQIQVKDFVAFLQTRYPLVQPVQDVANTSFIEEPFVGMWCERDDMQDSSVWVRNVRSDEWEVEASE